MADEIGVDAPESSPARAAWRRRLSRWSRLVVPLAVMAGLAVVAVPRVRDHLALGSARALIADWATARNLDGQRDSLVTTVEQRAGFADAATIKAAIRDADREETDALIALRARISHRSTWGHDVAVAAQVAVTALTAKIDLVRQDAAAAHPLPALAGVPDGAAVGRAVDVIGQLQVRRHLEGVHAGREALAPLRRELDLLDRPTDTPTGLHLITAEGGQLFVYDLDNGTRSRVAGDLGGATYTEAAGRGVVATGPFGARFLAAGQPARTLTRRPVSRVLPYGGDGFWLGTTRAVRSYDRSGRATSGWYDVPPHLGPPFGATRSTIALFRAEAGVRTARGQAAMRRQHPPTLTAWTPSTGRTHRLRRGCALPITTVDQILMVICPADRVFAYDVATRRLTEHEHPDGSRPQFFEPTPSPDGRYIAVQVDDPTGATDLLDLATDRLTRFPALLVGASPSAWSADGTWLLLTTNDGLQSRYNAFVLWNASTGNVMSVRLPAGASATAVGIALV